MYIRQQHSQLDIIDGKSHKLAVEKNREPP